MKTVLFVLFANLFWMVDNGIAQTVNYKIIYDSPWLQAHKPIRVKIDALSVDMIGESFGMGIGLGAEYFYKKYGSFHLERRMAYLDDKTLTEKDDWKAKLKHYGLTDVGVNYNLNVKTKKTTARLVVASKQTKGNKFVYTESLGYDVEGTVGKVKSLRAGAITFRNPGQVYKDMWMLNSSNLYLGLMSYSSMNVWAESEYGLAGFFNRMGIYVDVIYNLKTTRTNFEPKEGENVVSTGDLGFRVGFLYDGFSDGRHPNLKAFPMKLETGLFPGSEKRFYLGFGTGICFDAGWKKAK